MGKIGDGRTYLVVGTTSWGTGASYSSAMAVAKKNAVSGKNFQLVSSYRYPNTFKPEMSGLGSITWPIGCRVEKRVLTGCPVEKCAEYLVRWVEVSQHSIMNQEPTESERRGNLLAQVLHVLDAGADFQCGPKGKHLRLREEIRTELKHK